MITVSDFINETGMKRRTVQRRIEILKLKVQRAGRVIVLSRAQAEKIKAMSGKPGPKTAA